MQRKQTYHNFVVSLKIVLRLINESGLVVVNVRSVVIPDREMRWKFTFMRSIYYLDNFLLLGGA